MSDPGGGVGAALQAHTVQSSAQMRQVLAAYVRNAHTLTGPSRLEEQIGTGKYKLASDVVLHRVGGPVDPTSPGSYRRDVGYNGQNFDLNKQIWLHREKFMRQFQEQQILSEKEKLRDRQYRPAPPSHERTTHLSGEKIRLLRESQKEAEKLRQEKRVKDELMKDNKQHVKSAFKPPSLPPVSCVPIMSSSDKSWSELEETLVDGERISCFNVGGEPRLCLPQILNSVLERLSLKDINQACEELQIYCATCSPDQLQVLKDSKVLPETAYQCGLITKSDAERLCSFLLERNPPRASIRLGDPKTSPFSFKVEHDCFGRCEGIVLPEAYTGPTARCIECLICQGLFSPQKFVIHAHDNTENRTCHWGFSSDHWRVYLRLSDSYSEEEKERHVKVLDDFKLRYLPSNGIKRQQEEDHYEIPEIFSHSKRTKLEESPAPNPGDPYTLNTYLGLPSFRPWSPGKGSGPPYPFPPQPYRSVSKEKIPEPPKFAPYQTPNPGERYKNLSPQSVLPKKKYLEKENERFPTLADEISTIKEALDGAPVHAKEAVLKILERLTARVDRAERDRDLAVTRFRELNIKYETLEDELAKKRGELRELLRQVDCKPERDEESRNSKPSLESKDEDCDARSERSSESSASKADSYSKSGLPKIELKSPAKILEEISSPHSSSVSAGSEDRDSDIINQPTKEPENLKERMIKMEAELTALREELSIRSRPNQGLHAKSPIPVSLTYTTRKLGSNGDNSNSPTPSPPSPGVTLPVD